MQNRILIVVPRMNQGGAETYASLLANSLMQNGCEVHVASGGGRLAECLRRQGIPHYFVPIRYSIRLSSMILSSLIKQKQITLVHANAEAAGLAVAAPCAELGIPWLMTAHSTIMNREKDRPLREARKVICVSDFLRGFLVEQGLFDPKQMVTIYNGIDWQQFRNPLKTLSLRVQWGIPSNAFVLGIVSRLSPAIIKQDYKGHGDLFEILAHRPEARSWYLMVAGRGEGLGELKKQVRNLGIQDRVKFLGLVTDIPAFLSEIDVFTLPTRAETFGIAVIEAMSAEKPVVVYDVGGLPEVVVNGESGFLVPLGDTGQFSQRLNELACDAALRQRIGVMACKHVAESFTIDMMTEQVLRVYESVDHPGNGR